MLFPVLAFHAVEVKQTDAILVVFLEAYCVYCLHNISSTFWLQILLIESKAHSLLSK